MIELAARPNRRLDPFEKGRRERPSLLVTAAARYDRETEASVDLAAALPATMSDSDGAAATNADSQLRTDADAVVHEVYCQLNQRLPGRICDLHVNPATWGALELTGVTSSYYVKQLAQHIAMDVARLRRVVNRIEVRPPR